VAGQFHVGQDPYQRHLNVAQEQGQPVLIQLVLQDALEFE